MRTGVQQRQQGLGEALQIGGGMREVRLRKWMPVHIAGVLAGKEMVNPWGER